MGFRIYGKNYKKIQKNLKFDFENLKTCREPRLGLDHACMVAKLQSRDPIHHVNQSKNAAKSQHYLLL